MVEQLLLSEEFKPEPAHREFGFAVPWIWRDDGTLWIGGTELCAVLDDLWHVNERNPCTCSTCRPSHAHA